MGRVRSRCRRRERKIRTGPGSFGCTTFLKGLQPSPIVPLSRAVAIAMLHSPRAGPRAHRCTRGSRRSRQLPHSARAYRLRRAGSSREAAKAYARALTLFRSDSKRRFLERRLREDQLPGT